MARGCFCIASLAKAVSVRVKKVADRAPVAYLGKPAWWLWASNRELNFCTL